MVINLDNLDPDTQTKYVDFKKKVQNLLAQYQATDSDRFNLVREKIEQTNGNWNATIDLITRDLTESIHISQLLAYEYALGSEKITKGKVAFEAVLDKLFDGVQKFRIGNPIPGIDDECLYGKAFDDETAIPVTAKLYRLVMPAGAQHLQYFKNEKPAGAVYIYEKGTIKGIAQDENGNSVDIQTDGIDFTDLRHGQSLLTNLRQTAFHEWTHNAERETIDETEHPIDYEYVSIDGKKYRNYQRTNNYVTAENIKGIQEPQYVVRGKEIFFVDENKKLQPIYDKDGKLQINFHLAKKQLEQECCISTGLTTREILPDGEPRIHNQITEGFVEATARALVMAVDENVQDIDDGKYFEQVEMAKRVISARDKSFGEEGEGQTYADFIIHSSVLKRDLEERTVIDDGKKTDGLHYISDYADDAKSGKTDRWQFISNENMQKICKHLGLSDPRRKIEPIGLTEILQLTKIQKKQLKDILMSGANPDELFVDEKIAELMNILEKEKNFYESISEKLGYTDMTMSISASQNTILQSGIEATEGVRTGEINGQEQTIKSIEQAKPPQIEEKNSDVIGL